MKTFKVGDRVTWVRKGKGARAEGMEGVQVTGTVVEINYTAAPTPRLVVEGDFKTIFNGHVLTFQQVEHIT